MSFFFGLLLTFLAIFLILLVLVQRGRGGGLAGALGGMGGSSAFGAKAGDVFTRITIVVAAIWIVACLLVGHWAKHRGDLFTSGGTPISPPSSAVPTDPSLPLTAPLGTPASKSESPAETKGTTTTPATGTGATEQPATTGAEKSAAPPVDAGKAEK